MSINTNTSNLSFAGAFTMGKAERSNLTNDEILYIVIPNK